MNRSTYPAWVESLDMPVWVTDLACRIVHVNDPAESLLGKTTSECRGIPCYSIVRGKSPSGEAVCRLNCAVHRCARTHVPIAPFTVVLDGRGRTRASVQVVVIASTERGGSGQQLVHCVVDNKRERRFKQYLNKVVARSAEVEQHSLDEFRLTSREQQVLALLAEDETLYTIAEQLKVSYPTVRNHVQHILNKLGVHSILEAVAFYLLSED